MPWARSAAASWSAHRGIFLRGGAACGRALAHDVQPLLRADARTARVPGLAAERAEREEATRALRELALEHAVPLAARAVADVGHRVKAPREHARVPALEVGVAEVGRDDVWGQGARASRLGAAEARQIRVAEADGTQRGQAVAAQPVATGEAGARGAWRVVEADGARVQRGGERGGARGAVVHSQLQQRPLERLRRVRRFRCLRACTRHISNDMPAPEAIMLSDVGLQRCI
jgi:hypothetical protein